MLAASRSAVLAEAKVTTSLELRPILVREPRRSLPPQPQVRHGTRTPDLIALRSTPLRAASFDWDDNIVFMPTRVTVFGPNGETREVGTAEWAVVRQELGKPGPWEHFTVRPESYARANDPHDNQNFFLEDLRRAIAAGDAWQGPSWNAFVKAMSRPETAARTTIITARGHAPCTIYAGLVWLRDNGYIAHVVPPKNIFPVTHPAMDKVLPSGSLASPSLRKTAVMLELIDALCAEPRDVRAPNSALRQWTFSDDDYGNFELALRVLSEHMQRGRWPSIKIVLHYTGQHDPQQPPRTEILLPPSFT